MDLKCEGGPWGRLRARSSVVGSSSEAPARPAWERSWLPRSGLRRPGRPPRPPRSKCGGSPLVDSTSAVRARGTPPVATTGSAASPTTAARTLAATAPCAIRRSTSSCGSSISSREIEPSARCGTFGGSRSESRGGLRKGITPGSASGSAANHRGARPTAPEEGSRRCCERCQVAVGKSRPSGSAAGRSQPPLPETSSLFRSKIDSLSAPTSGRSGRLSTMRPSYPTERRRRTESDGAAHPRSTLPFPFAR